VNDIKPLPRHVQWWRRTRNQRLKAYSTMGSLVGKLIVLAIQVLGGMLISYGVYQASHAAGFIVAGFICWLLLWSHEQDKKGRVE
jgi:hypothetical protein